MNEVKLLKIEEVANKLRCSKSWVYQSVALRKIPFIKLNGLLLFDESKINDWVSLSSHTPENA